MSIPSPRTSTQESADARRKQREQRFLERQAWIDAVQRRRDLTPAARLIGGRLGGHKNLITGQCNPGYRTLAEESGYPVRTAIRAIAELEQKGCIKVKRTSGGVRSNCYTLIPQPATSVATARVKAGVTSDKRRAAPVSPQHPNLEKNIGGSKEPPYVEERESVVLAHDDSTPPDRGADADAPPRSFKQASQAEETYSEVRAVWQRPWCDDQRADRLAFERACEEGTPAEIILDAAKAWVAAADAPRFLPPLARWLDGRGWERQPPQKARRSAAPKDRHRHNGRKRDISAEFFKLGSMRHAFERSAAS